MVATKELERNYYTPFGMQMPGRTYSSPSYRYGFNGEEKDVEITSSTGTDYNYGMRIYDARLGRFMSVDPEARKYPYFSPYLFAANNPIKYVDVFGLGPGDKFTSADAAAIDFSKTYNDNSIANKVEYATSIYKITTAKEVYYTYSAPNKGEAASSTNSNRGLLGMAEGDELVGHAHTHAQYDANFDNENFSGTDKTNAKSSGVPNYVATPQGTLKKLEIDAQGNNNISTIATDIPSDPNDPYRVNTVDPSVLPKDEPTNGVWDFIKHNILGPIGYGASAVQGKDNMNQGGNQSNGSSEGSTNSSSGGSTNGSSGGANESSGGCSDECTE